MNSACHDSYHSCLGYHVLEGMFMCVLLLHYLFKISLFALCEIRPLRNLKAKGLEREPLQDPSLSWARWPLMKMIFLKGLLKVMYQTHLLNLNVSLSKRVHQYYMACVSEKSCSLQNLNLHCKKKKWQKENKKKIPFERSWPSAESSSKWYITLLFWQLIVFSLYNSFFHVMITLCSN